MHASLAALASLLALLHPLVPILIIHATDLGVDEDIVGFGDIDEFLVRGLVAGVLVRVVLFGQRSVGLFDLPVVGVFVEAEELCNNRLGGSTRRVGLEGLRESTHLIVVFCADCYEWQDAQKHQSGEEEHLLPLS